MWLLLMCPLLVTWSATQARALTRNRTGDPAIHRWVRNPLSNTSLGLIISVFLNESGGSMAV